MEMSLGGDYENFQSDFVSEQGEESGHYSSVSSSGPIGNDNNYQKMTSDFKQAIANRKTPRHLVMLSRVIMGVIFVTLALSAVIFNLQITFTDHVGFYGYQLVY